MHHVERRWAEQRLQLQRPQLCVFVVRRRSRWAEQLGDGGQRQGRSVQHVKQTLIERVMGGLWSERGGKDQHKLITERVFSQTDIRRGGGTLHHSTLL